MTQADKIHKLQREIERLRRTSGHVCSALRVNLRHNETLVSFRDTEIRWAIDALQTVNPYPIEKALGRYTAPKEKV